MHRLSDSRTWRGLKMSRPDFAGRRFLFPRGRELESLPLPLWLSISMVEPLFPPRHRSRLVRWLLIGVGAVSLLLGLIGVVLPLFPTVPFLLVTAACWMRASPRWHRWLLSLPRLGPAIERWERERTISRPARWTALGSITVSMGATIWWMRDHVWLPWALTCFAVVLLLAISRLPTARDGTH